MLYSPSRKPFRQCSSKKFDYLFSLQGFIQEVVKSPKRKKSHSPVQKSIQFVHGPTTQICVTPVYLELRSDLGDLEHPYLICTSLFYWPKTNLKTC